ncbi:MAG: pyridoxamine 5'-phosphate oxidase family protein [Desulfobacterales bacterium]
MMDTKRRGTLKYSYDLTNMLKKIKALILRKDSCVLATTDGETPHCSLMAYVPDDSGERLFLITSSASRKYQNIRRHPRVSLLIDTRGEQQRELTHALTVTGTCDILQDTGEIAHVKATSARQHPQLDDLIRKYEMVVMCVQVDFFLLLNGPERAYFESLDS